MVANVYLEGTYSEYYNHISQTEAGMQRLFKQFSFPGGIPSHVAPETPGSINEGGELGYSLSHAYGAVVRQSRPHRRAASSATARPRPGPGGRLAVEQVPQPGHRRRGAAHPPSERLEDRQPDGAGAHQPGGVDRVLRGPGLHPVLRRGDRPGQGAPADGRHPRPRARRDRRVPAPGAARTASSSGRAGR